MNRRFGIELEIADITQAKAAAALQAVGLTVVTSGYTHQTDQRLLENRAGWLGTGRL